MIKFLKSKYIKKYGCFILQVHPHFRLFHMNQHELSGTFSTTVYKYDRKGRYRGRS